MIFAILAFSVLAQTPTDTLSPAQRAKAEWFIKARLPCLGCHVLGGEGGARGGVDRLQQTGRCVGIATQVGVPVLDGGLQHQVVEPAGVVVFVHLGVLVGVHGDHGQRARGLLPDPDRPLVLQYRVTLFAR